MTPREQMDIWVAAHKSSYHPWPAFVRSVRAALGIIDDDHKLMPYNNMCRCERTNPGYECWVKKEHEAALWKAIGGQE